MIIITGASRGIGHFLFEKFHKEGLPVVGFCRTALIEDEYKSSFYPIDITHYDQIVSAVQLIPNLSEIILINCAGISYNSYAHKADLEQWRNVIEVNLIGTFNVIHALLPIMRSQGYGRIINFASVVTKIPTPGVSAYAASKAALNSLTRNLSIENASKGITVNSINLGYTDMGMGHNDISEKFHETIVKRIPQRRFCQPIEIYQTVKYIMDMDYLTGSMIDLDGGIV
ncbi:MAG: SDR family oxidoreductase [Muribaculaceae bacterium]